jgi:hypothetical protein
MAANMAGLPPSTPRGGEGHVDGQLVADGVGRGPVADAFGNAVRRRRLRTATWVPTTNMTSANPMLADSWNVGLAASTTPRPVLPTTSPATSSPTTTGIRRRGTDAKNGPAKPIAVSSASV